MFATGQANGGTGTPGASGAPAASGGRRAVRPPPASGPAADVHVQAKGVAFVEKTWSAPAGRPFTIAFDNEDPATPHNVALVAGSGAEVFKGAIFPGVETRVYNVPAQPAGEYKFVCTVHPTMTGTATLK